MKNLLKIGHKEYKLNFENTNFFELVKKEISEYYKNLKDKGLKDNLDLQEEDIKLSIDINLIKRILNNLIEIQIKHNNGEFINILFMIN